MLSQAYLALRDETWSVRTQTEGVGERGIVENTWAWERQVAAGRMKLYESFII